MPDIENPLTGEDFDQLEKALSETAKIERAINKATQAGVDMGDALQQNRDSRTRIQKLLTAYKSVS